MSLIPEHWRWFDHKKPDYDRAWTQRLDMLKRIRSGAVDTKALKAYYADNPVAWICDWGVTFDPRNIELGLPAMLPFILFERQAECIVWVLERWKNREHGLVEKARDMGISWIMVALFAHMFLFKEAFAGGMGSRKEVFVDDGDANPASLFWKLRSFISTLPVELRPTGWLPSRDAIRMKTINPENGATLVGEAGEGIGRGARTSLFLIDEAAFIPGAAGVDAALSQTTNCVIWASTVNGTGNLFHQKRHSGKVKVFVFDWRQDPRKDQAWYDAQVGKFDKAVVAAEIDRDYNASTTDSYIAGKLTTAALALGPADVMPMGPLMVGIDVARFGDDKSCFTARQGRVVYRQEVFGHCDVVDVAGRAVDWIRTLPEMPAQIAVDTIGLGAGVADILRRHPVYGKLVVDVNSSLRLDNGEDYNLRAYMWRQMKDWLATRCSIPTESDLATELTSLRYKYSGNLLLIESKKDAKARGIKSPDCADSLALTFAVAPKKDETPPQAQAAWATLDELTAY